MSRDLERYNHLKYNQKSAPETEKEDFIDFLFEHSEIKYPEVDENEAWDRFSSQLSSEKKESKSVWLKIAASVAILLSVSLAIFLTSESEQLQVVSQAEITTVTFPDGSTGVLNQNSVFEYPEEFGNERNVTFRGEAYFDIQKSEKPFVINANGVDVKVLGTAFNLITTNEEVVLYVDRGLVAFSKNGIETKVTAGLEAVFNKESEEVEIRKQPTRNNMSWRNGEFKFDNTPLKEALGDLTEYYQVGFKLSNDKLENCRISASFNEKSLGEVLGLLEEILDVKVKLKDKTVKISGKGC